MKRRYKALILVIMLFSIMACQLNANIAYAYEEKVANIVCDASQVVAARAGAGTEYEIQHNLANGKAITVIDEATASDGSLWYKVRYNLIKDNSECVSFVKAEYVAFVTDDSYGIMMVSEPYATGTVTGNNLKVRSGAGTGNTVITSLYSGDVVNIIGQTTVNGVIWYNITGNKNGVDFNGWSSGNYITVSYTSAGDTTYAGQLRAAGFPESYIPNLTALHAKFPNWTFTPLNTGIDWNTVLDKECANGVNLVSSTADDAKKSTNPGAYNWNTNKWTEYETGWVSVGREYLAYCMDPRNFLDETNIFMFENISYNGSQTLLGVQGIVAGSFMEGIKSYTNNGESIDYANTIFQIAQTSGVSSYHLASKIRQEQGVNGTSPLISGTYSGYEGYYNFFNFNAYGSTKAAIYARGLSYAKNQGWSSRYLSILGGANKIKSDYIDRGQNTIYLEKFNVSSASALGTHQYMSNVTGAISEGQSVAKGYTDKSQSFNFVIPVYANMPESACTFSLSGNPNNYLGSLSVAGLSLTPGFDPTKESYSIVVDNSVSSVNVTATTLVSTSNVTGIGNYNLNEGNNIIQVNCIAQTGAVRTYTINISRLASGVTGGNVISSGSSVTSSVYSIGTYITGIQPGTDAATFMSGLVSTDTIKLLDASGNEKTGTVATGNVVAVYDASGNMKSSLKVVIYGDVNGDGTISVLDMIKMNRHIIGKSALTEAYLEAADANRKGDGATVLDMIIMNNHITGKKTISQ